MSTEARWRQILAAVEAQVQVGVADLKRLTGASAATIRRDLKALEDKRLVLRVHGGVIEFPREASVPEKSRTHVAEKTAIGRLASSYIQEGEVVLLDAGTTTGMIIRELRHFRHITVVTNAVNILVGLLPFDSFEVIMLGGTLRSTNQAVVGPLTEDNLRHIRPDRAFMGAYGVDLRGRGLVSPTLSQAYLKGAMMQAARHVYVAVDHTKLGEPRYGFVTPLPADATLLIDDRVSIAQRQQLEAAGLAFCLAPTEPGPLHGISGHGSE